MTDRELEHLLPWIASGAEECTPEQRRQLERLLAESPEAGQLDAVAKLLADPSGQRTTDARSGPIHPHLLIQFAEAPEQLDDETRRWIEQRIAGNPQERAELEALRRADAAAMDHGGFPPASQPVPPVVPIWQRLSRVAFHPLAASAYLAAAVVMGVMLLVPAPAPQRSPVIVAPPVVPVAGEQAFRDEPGAPSDLPRLARSIRPTGLWLDTGLQRSDLDDARTSFSLELGLGEERVWSEPVVRESFVEQDGKTMLLAYIVTEHLVKGAEYRLSLRIDRPGDPLRDQAVVEYRFIVSGRADP